MKHNTDLIRYLYGEQELDRAGSEAFEEIHQAELAALRAAKTALERKAPERPEASTIDAVLSAARTAGEPKRTDRSPVPHARTRSRRPVWIRQALLIGGLAVTTLLWALAGHPLVSGQEDVAQVEALPQQAMPQQAPAARAATAHEAEPLPLGWDDPADLQAIRWRIQAMQEASRGLEWDDSAPLIEIDGASGFSTGARTPGLYQTGNRGR